MRLAKLLFVTFLAFIISTLFFFASPTSTLAAVFNPSYGVTLISNTAGAASNVQFRITNPATSELINLTTLRIPAGWTVASGSSLADGAQIGNGSFTAVVSGVTQTFPYVIKNSTTLNGHLVHAIVDLSPVPVTSDVYVDGNSSTGYTIPTPLPAGVSFNLPTDSIFTLNGVVSGINFIVNPSLQGDYTWSADFTSVSSATVTRSQVLSIPGTVTPTGSNVTATFSNGSSVTFSSVSAGGVTNIATSTTAPPQGTGQFQIAPGGTYFDYTTTSTFACPCTITLPYDPATNPNPRIYHLNSITGLWEDATTAVNTTAHTVTGVVNSFSVFVVASPNFTVAWQNSVAKLMINKGNPFPLDSGEDLGIKFNLHDSSGANATPDNVTVQIWQTTDASGSAIVPVKVSDLSPKLNAEKARYQTEFDLENAGLSTGATYEIRVVVDITVVTQTPTAVFKVVSDDGHQEASDSADPGNDN